MREAGYYWVMNDDIWEVGYWDGEAWLLIMEDNYYDDTAFIEIDECQIIRQSETKQEISEVGYIDD